MKDKAPLIRNPEDWARDWGWVSRRRALNAAARIGKVADALEEDLDPRRLDGEALALRDQVHELRAIARALAPVTVPAERKIRAINAREAAERS
jgi:hypothetical protein